jgi:hypothetical protein
MTRGGEKSCPYLDSNSDPYAVLSGSKPLYLRYPGSLVGWLLNNELEGIWKEAAVL